MRWVLSFLEPELVKVANLASCLYRGFWAWFYLYRHIYLVPSKRRTRSVSVHTSILDGNLAPCREADCNTEYLPEYLNHLRQRLFAGLQSTGQG